MALTFDEKKEILELYGREYSQGKIGDKTGHSPTTIRKVINEAAEEVFKLKAEGLEPGQIGLQLDYPLAFIDIALKKHEEKQKEEVKAEVKAEGTAEEIESPKKLDVKTELREFQKKQEIEQRKERIRVRAIDSIDNLEVLENEYREEKVFDEAYDRRQKAIKKELRDFVLVKVDEIDSIKTISAFEHICEEISEKIVALFDEYDKKVDESKELRKNIEKKRSDQLLDKKIDIPLFPGFVKSQIKRMVLVRTDEEASIVHDAMTQFALYMVSRGIESPERQQKIWPAFTKNVEESGWDYLRRQATMYRKGT